MNLDEFSVVVDGDVTLNWNLATEEAAAARATLQPGGAGLLRELVAATAPRPIEIHPATDPQAAAPTDDRFHQRFAVWSRQDRRRGEKRGDKAWRVEKFLGMQRAAASPEPAADRGPDRADLVVLHDAGLGFRDQPEAWPRAIAEPGSDPPWILLRTVKKVAEGKLWEHLQDFAEKTIAVIRIDDLRLGGMHVTRELSWERTAQDLLSELCDNEQLRRCAHVVVSFTTAGALVLSREGGDGGEPCCRLVFDPAVMERMWNEAHAGDMIGGVTALMAAITREIMLAPDDPDVVWGVRCGIAAMRELDLGGYAEQPGSAGPGRAAQLEYPTEQIARVLAAEKPAAKDLPTEQQPFAEAPVRDPHLGGAWTILEDRHPPGDLLELASEIVRDGYEKALRQVPRGQFGDLVTFDRTEIEGLQSVRMLIRQYAERERPSHPLSIAVFGPPGAGKSWSVKQVAEGVLGKEVEEITFNLSQFDEPKGLIDAFYQVRDISLGGKLPLVLWDEFDSNRFAAGGPQTLGWLPHFLAPMEDGKFQDGQLSHPIGKAVFVFAGGVYQQMDAFAENSEKLRDAKAPDFVSRLRGYVNVVGPNPRDNDRGRDRYFLIRRAVMARQLLLRSWPGIFHEALSDAETVQRAEIDDGVLRALLLTDIYRHGTRSLGSVISTSVVRGQDHFGRSDLPSEAQLNLHVDAADFLALVHGSSRDGTAREAEAMGGDPSAELEALSPRA